MCSMALAMPLAGLVHSAKPEIGVETDYISNFMSHADVNMLKEAYWELAANLPKLGPLQSMSKIGVRSKQ